MQLTATYLNGQDCTASLTNASSHTITEVLHPNDTRGYILKVPFDDPVVIKQVKVSEFVQWLLQISSWFIHGDVILLVFSVSQFSKDDEAMQHKMDFNFTLTVVPENESFYHLGSVTALTEVCKSLGLDLINPTSA